MAAPTGFEPVPPKEGRPEIIPPSPDQVRTLIEAAAQGDEGVLWSTLVLVLATTGRRRGEICGLRWSDVDLKVGRVAIYRVVKVVDP